MHKVTAGVPVLGHSQTSYPITAVKKYIKESGIGPSSWVKSVIAPTSQIYINTLIVQLFLGQPIFSKTLGTIFSKSNKSQHIDCSASVGTNTKSEQLHVMHNITVKLFQPTATALSLFT